MTKNIGTASAYSAVLAPPMSPSLDPQVSLVDPWQPIADEPRARVGPSEMSIDSSQRAKQNELLLGAIRARLSKILVREILDIPDFAANGSASRS
ncbi:hypothetical protein DdX_14155 [Ditylenchus destructor]|uniref:Uncharacterized protein n=1 Tax=Ditylenchus destructor TaxID=166010 RepID=A0AAD4MX96_9BILA|nr:hypothetical protein DdX_14155 [Ditylenchus destructor]